MTRLPLPPAEVPATTSADGLAPKFARALVDVCLALAHLGWQPVLRETLRTNVRAVFLYGFGRDYDDGRGIVTNATDALGTWHHFGLAADVGDRRYDSGQEPAAFWRDLERCAVQHGLTSGADWKFCDRPHVQWHCDGMHVSPSPHAAELLASGGIEAVWRELHAVDDSTSSTENAA
jgi:hypothetical protein